jgi:hypothetical protein
VPNADSDRSNDYFFFSFKATKKRRKADGQSIGRTFFEWGGRVRYGYMLLDVDGGI